MKKSESTSLHEAIAKLTLAIKSQQQHVQDQRTMQGMKKGNPQGSRADYVAYTFDVAHFHAACGPAVRFVGNGLGKMMAICLMCRSVADVEAIGRRVSWEQVCDPELVHDAPAVTQLSPGIEAVAPRLREAVQGWRSRLLELFRPTTRTLSPTRISQTSLGTGSSRSSSRARKQTPSSHSQALARNPQHV
jgi:hypothetical protein